MRNRVYLGEIPHRDQSHPGLHSAIITAELFEAVQTRLDANARRRKSTGEKVARSPLTGRIFDADDQPMSPTFAYGRNGRLYRYYVSAPLQRGGERRPDDDTPRRVPAAKFENRLLTTITRFLPNLPADPIAIVTRIEIHANSVQLLLPLEYFNKIKDRLDPRTKAEPDLAEPEYFRLSLPWRMQVCSGRTEILIGAQNTSQPYMVLIKALRTAHTMIAMDTSRNSVLDTAPTTPWRRQLVRLAFLAPDIQRVILEGRQPSGLTLTMLMKSEIPLLWPEQCRRFGVENKGRKLLPHNIENL